MLWREMQSSLHITYGFNHTWGIRKGSPEEMSFQLIWKRWAGAEELCRQKEKKPQGPYGGKGAHWKLKDGYCAQSAEREEEEDRLDHAELAGHRIEYNGKPRVSLR